MATRKSSSKKTSKIETSIKVDAIKHDEKRINIPTADLAVRLAESSDAHAVKYPRDTSLDPQLVWRGKDDQDASDLAVPVVPIYIQEKIDPRVIVENLRDTATPSQPEHELTLFDEFDGLTGTQILEFYEHEGNWSNRLILGDSLLVMNSLAEKEHLRAKVQVVYFDPPYGIKFGSNWQVSTKDQSVKDGNISDVTRQPEQVKAFRDTWELGIHSYLAYLRDRLVVARDLLTETGSIFVQIGDENLHLVRSLMDEVFGSNNFVSVITYQKTSSANAAAGLKSLGAVADYIIWYAKSKSEMKYRQLYSPKSFGSKGASGYTNVELADGTRRPMTKIERENPDLLPEGAKIFVRDNLTSQSGSDIGRFEVEIQGRKFRPGSGVWKTNKDGMNRLIKSGRVIVGNSGINYLRYLDDFAAFPLNNVWTDATSGFMSDKVYVVQSNSRIVERCVNMASDPGDLVLDPTCGSGTTAYVAERLGRRWITIDTSRVAFAIARTRLMTSKFPYFYLADSADGHAIESSMAGGNPVLQSFRGDVRKGFVCQRIPHITLKSIANNALLDNEYDQAKAKQIVEKFAEYEILLDQPIEDKNKVRVAGPFTVETLSPHRSLNVEESNRSTDFVERIIEHLKRSGVQNTYKGERLVFDRLELYPGEWLNGEGEYTNAEGKSKRVAVVIGPEHGTVSPDLIRESAIEATDGRGFDVLIVCGLAFDPLVGEQAKKFGRLVVLPTKINPDLTMPDGLLKNTGSGNLFTVFGEPDIELVRSDDGKIAVRVNGVDVYDPTTGVVRSGSVSDIACWFIDSNYDQKSFFVRHAYFTGGNEPYESLAKTLRTEISLDAWTALYSNESQPFDPPSSGRIAVKVINHFGDEVMQVYSLM